MIEFRQTDGRISLNGEILGAYPQCYSGHGLGMDNPAFESVHGVGVIPRGRWEIVKWYDNYGPKGPIVARLEPISHDAYDRNGFLIHGDNSAMNHTASDGCIIAPHDIRVKLRESGETALEVVE